jgi:hypothetical protein
MSPWTRGRDQDLLDVRAEQLAVDGSIDHPRRIDAIVAEGGDEGHGLPMTIWDIRCQALQRGRAPLCPWSRARQSALGQERKDGGRDLLIDLQTNNSFRVDRRMALGTSLPLLSAVFNWRVLGLSSSHRLQREAHARAFAHRSQERRAAGDGLSGRYPHQVHDGCAVRRCDRALISYFSGDFAAAGFHCEQALATCEAEWDLEVLERFGDGISAAAMSFLALTAWQLRDVERARQLIESANRRAADVTKPAGQSQEE